MHLHAYDLLLLAATICIALLLRSKSTPEEDQPTETPEEQVKFIHSRNALFSNDKNLQ